MPKYLCKCVYTILLGEVPSPNQYMIISDIDYEKYQGLINAEDLYLKMSIVTKCSNCGRLYIYWNGFNNAPSVYKVE